MDAYAPTVVAGAARRSSLDNLAEKKAALRREAAECREALHAANPDAGGAILARFQAAAALSAAAAASISFAGYWPIRSEIDPRPLMYYLLDLGLSGALPVTVAGEQGLQFRHWSKDTVLQPGPFGVAVPPAGVGTVVPDLVLVPQLAYAKNGHRLGYGAGYYDRTLDELRRTHQVLAVGLAYAGQHVDDLPVGPGDQRLDWVVTENGASRMA